MIIQETDTTIIDGYWGILNSLSPNNKLELISKLSTSLKSDIGEKKSYFKKSFGAFESQATAEEIIKEIKSSRISNREIEPF